MTMPTIRKAALAAFLGLGLFAGCSEETTDKAKDIAGGAAAKTGEVIKKGGDAVENAADKVGDAAKTATEKTGDALDAVGLDKAAENVRGAGEKVGDAAETATEKTGAAVEGAGAALEKAGEDLKADPAK